ncbi:hypothetical protein Hanom_Chr04g00360121 [Helianthus anomalus]
MYFLASPLPPPEKTKTTIVSSLPPPPEKTKTIWLQVIIRSLYIKITKKYHRKRKK